MNIGTDVTAERAAIDLAASQRRDYVVPLKSLSVRPSSTGRPVVWSPHSPEMALSPLADAQLATMLGIGSRFSSEGPDRPARPN